MLGDHSLISVGVLAAFASPYAAAAVPLALVPATREALHARVALILNAVCLLGIGLMVAAVSLAAVSHRAGDPRLAMVLTSVPVLQTVVLIFTASRTPGTITDKRVLRAALIYLCVFAASAVYVLLTSGGEEEL